MNNGAVGHQDIGSKQSREWIALVSGVWAGLIRLESLYFSPAFFSHFTFST
jgi:hypothetical protein